MTGRSWVFSGVLLGVSLLAPIARADAERPSWEPRVCHDPAVSYGEVVTTRPREERSVLSVWPQTLCADLPRTRRIDSIGVYVDAPRRGDEALPDADEQRRPRR